MHLRRRFTEQNAWEREIDRMICPHCGTANDPGEHFCADCGAQLGSNNTPTVTGATNGGKGPAAGLTPGMSLQNGRYVITKALGEGGMGSVLLAKDTRLAGKLYVVKVLNAESTDPDKLQADVRNFQREAETLAHLKHPLVPAVTDHFEENLHYYMVMDYVDGENLEDWLERTNKPMKEQDALRYALEVLDILEYLSQQQPAIVHRDIKPANIIIGTNDKHAHLVDFGIARTNVLVGGQRRKTTALGTPGYAPPEQYQGFADPRSDLYALAATLHHLITNRDPGEYAPFQFPPARTLNSQVSPQLEQILIKALKPDTHERYQTPQDMQQDIESLLAGTSIPGTTDGYRLSGSLPPRTLPQQPPRQKIPASSSNDPFETLAQAAERLRQDQQTQTGYGEPGSYQTRPRQRQRQIFQEPQPFEQFRPRQPQNQWNQFNYRNNSSQDENQLMWRFILFVVVICVIILLAFLLFGSIGLP